MVNKKTYRTKSTDEIEYILGCGVRWLYMASLGFKANKYHS